MSLIKCCKDCSERYPACHDSCKRYIKEKTEALEAKLKQSRDGQIEHDIRQIKKRKKR